LSKRFLLQRYLGLTEEEIAENEELWREERDEPEMSTNAGQDLRSIGITPGALEGDIQTGEEVAGMAPGGAGAPPVTPGAAPGAMPAGAPTPPAV
jgi:DsbC/DsbD-like thiol-disulfide interchange protein